MLRPVDPDVEVTREEGALTVSWPSHHRGPGIFLICYSVFMFGMCVLMAHFEPRPDPRHISAEQFWSIGGIWLFAIALALFGAHHVFLRTRIFATPEMVAADTSPIRFRRSFQAEGVKQFFVAAPKLVSQEGRSAILKLYMLDKNDHPVVVAGGFLTSFAAYQVRRELQKFYGLEDLPVYGETPETIGIPVYSGTRPVKGPRVV